MDNTSAFTLLAFALTMCAASKGAAPPIACNLKAMDSAARPRYHDLMNRLRQAVRESHELENGYALDLDSEAISLVERAESMNLERLCSPFLVLELGASGVRDHWILRVTSTSEAKGLIRAEFFAKQ